MTITHVRTTTPTNLIARVYYIPQDFRYYTPDTMDTSDTYSCAARVMNDTIASTTNKEYTWSLQF